MDERKSVHTDVNADWEIDRKSMILGRGMLYDYDDDHLQRRFEKVGG